MKSKVYSGDTTSKAQQNVLRRFQKRGWVLVAVRPDPRAGFRGHNTQHLLAKPSRRDVKRGTPLPEVPAGWEKATTAPQAS